MNHVIKALVAQKRGRNHHLNTNNSVSSNRGGEGGIDDNSSLPSVDSYCLGTSSQHQYRSPRRNRSLRSNATKNITVVTTPGTATSSVNTSTTYPQHNGTSTSELHPPLTSTLSSTSDSYSLRSIPKSFSDDNTTNSKQAPGKRWKMLRRPRSIVTTAPTTTVSTKYRDDFHSTPTTLPGSAINNDNRSVSSTSTTTRTTATVSPSSIQTFSPSPSSQSQPRFVTQSPRISQRKKKDTMNSNNNNQSFRSSTVQEEKKSSHDVNTYYVPEEQDPLVLLACASPEDRQPSQLSIDQCNKITAAVTALDKSGSDLFAAGNYQEAFLRFERALELKRKSLANHSLAWQQYEQSNRANERSTINASEHLNTYLGGSINNDLNNTDGSVPDGSTLGSLNILKSHPTYIATNKFSKKNLYNSMGDGISDGNSNNNDNEYKRNLIASVATSINNLTFLKQQNGKTSSEETLASYMQSLQMKLQVLGPTHLSVGKTLNNIGSVFYVQHKYTASLQAYLDAYLIMQNSLGTKHLDVATVASNIGDAYRCMDQINDALKYYKIALDIRWELLPHNHPKIFRLMEQTAELELKKGDPSFTLQRRRSSSSFSDDHDDDDDEHGSTTSRNMLKLLKAKAAEDMKFIEGLQRQAAIDAVTDKIIVSNEIRELTATNDVDDDNHRPDDNNEMNDLCNLMNSTLQIEERGKGNETDITDTAALEDGMHNSSIVEHTTDVSDLVNNLSSLSIEKSSKSTILRSSRRNLFGSDSESQLKASEQPQQQHHLQISASSSSSLLGGSSSHHRRIQHSLSSDDDHRQRALDAVKERLEQIRAIRREEGELALLQQSMHNKDHLNNSNHRQLNGDSVKMNSNAAIRDKSMYQSSSSSFVPLKHETKATIVRMTRKSARAIPILTSANPISLTTTTVPVSNRSYMGPTRASVARATTKIITSRRKQRQQQHQQLHHVLSDD